jgi:hypothetical protein
MSANNQIIVKQCQHGDWYVFECPAESWDTVNELPRSEAKREFGTEKEAWNFAMKLSPGTEYGAQAHLAKDGADVIINCDE